MEGEALPVRIVFFGSPEFAVPSLKALANDPRIVVPLVVTQPDRPAGRGRRLTAPAVKLAAEELDLPLIQPETLRDSATIDRIRAVQPELLVVVSYGAILRKSLLELAPHGVINVHPSLLPKYRGAAPIPAAILNGDSETGVSIIKLVRKLDAGPILRQSPMLIAPDETTATLSPKLAELGAEMLTDTSVDWVAGTISPQEQDDALATMTHEWTKADGRIKWTLDAASIERLVRASKPWPVAWTTFQEQPFRIHSARATDGSDDGQPGCVSAHDSAITVTTGDGLLILEQVQPAGKRQMDARAWWNGIPNETVDLL